jgi:adenylate cyclase
VCGMEMDWERDMKADAIGVRRRCQGACVMTDGEFYTSVAETIDPGAAVEFINRYFAMLFRPVYDHGGFVADVKGDGMLAVWVDGETTAQVKRRACLACLAIAESGRQFSQANATLGFGTRVGACFGPLALATLGTTAHSEYRAVGDTVNISSRLEQLNKELGTRVLVCADLAKGMDEFLFRDLGQFQLRGKVNRVHVCELVALRAASTIRQRALCSEFAAALGDYHHAHMKHALERFRELCARYPSDGPSRFYLERCRKAATERAGVALFLDPVPLSAGLHR